MIKSDGLSYIQRGFRDEEDTRAQAPWKNASSRKTFEMLYEQLVDDHGLSPLAAVDILECAAYAAVDEHGL